MRQALRSSLAAFAGVAVVAVCGDGLSALRVLGEQRPDLLIVDSNLLDEETEALLAAVKANWPRIFCVTILQTHQREAMVLAAGADAAVQRDDWSIEFPALLQKLAEIPDAPIA
jgi:DNA-binding NarL/FixJ family response regulator